MDSIRRDARRRGLRVAAQVAAFTGLAVAGAALSHAAEPPHASLGAGSDGASASQESGAASPADRLTEALRVRDVKSCGCVPCWGPPAPPPMRPELFNFTEKEALS